MSTDALVSAFRVSATLESLPFVRGAIALVLDRAPWRTDDAGRLLLAASEAVSNAIEHGSPSGDAQIEVQVRVHDDEATLVVTDEGRPGHVPRIDLRDLSPDPASTRGRGLLIMSRLADWMDVERAGAGTRLTLGFHLTGADAGDGRRAA
jgi:serine/threonine-protein kinase RsbW